MPRRVRNVRRSKRAKRARLLDTGPPRNNVNNKGDPLEERDWLAGAKGKTLQGDTGG